MSYFPVYRSTQGYIPLDSQSIKLTVRQHPEYALVTPEHKEKGRKPVDPPPIVQMHVDHTNEAQQHWLVNPFLFMMASLVDAKTDSHLGGNSIIGQCVSSLHKLKDIDNKEGGFFVFGDISCRKQGTYKLQFNLFDYDKANGNVVLVDSITSNEFQVVTSKEFKGLRESTSLSRSFSDQGVRLRLRKEPRTLTSTKRSWNGSSPETSTPTLHSNMYGGGPVHDHYRYSEPSAKRQRSDSDYSGPPWYPSYQNRSAQYGASVGNGSQVWTGQQQGLSNESSTSLAGIMSPAQTQSGSLWQRSAQMGPYPTAVVQSTGNAFFTSPNSVTNASRGYLSSNYGAQHGMQQYGMRTSGDNHATLTGLHTPTSMGDHNLTSSQHQSFGQSPQNVAGQSQELRHPMQQFTGRGLTLAPSIPSFQSTAHPVSNAISGYDAPDLPTSGPEAQYDHNQYPGLGSSIQNPYHDTRDSSETSHYPANSGAMQHGGLSALDTDLLSTSFTGNYGAAHGPHSQSTSSMHDQQELQEFKRDSAEYPTPHHSSVWG